MVTHRATVIVVFDVPAAAYGRFMGRYAEQLAARFADFAGVTVAAGSALDVGCGPGALTGVLVERLGDAHIAAVDPSPPFVAAAAVRFPAVDVRQSPAEELPFVDGTFDVVLAQLVVHFMTDPVRGLAEMVNACRASRAYRDGFASRSASRGISRNELGQPWVTTRGKESSDSPG